MAIEKITKFSDAIQPADIINEVVDVVNNADLEEFVGASESQAGKKGIVPAPEAGSEDRYLNADGTWKEVKQNLTIYTSLEQIGITPGEETFASIHSALPINSVLECYVSEVQNFADIYPASFGNFIATRLTGDVTIFHFTGINQIIYVTHYHVTNNTNPSWTQIAKQSDLTSLSNSINASLTNYLPLIGGLMSGTINTSKTTSSYRNGNLGQSIINSTAANGSYTVLATLNSTNGKFTLACYQGKMLLQYTSNATIATEVNKVDKSITLMDESGSTSLSTWTISKGTSGWARESSTGFTIQWGQVMGTRSNSEQQIGKFNFPRTFTTYYTMTVSLVNTDSVNPSKYDGGFQVRTVDKNGFYLYQQKYSNHAWFGTCNWIAIGIS